MEALLSPLLCGALVIYIHGTESEGSEVGWMPRKGPSGELFRRGLSVVPRVAKNSLASPGGENEPSCEENFSGLQDSRAQQRWRLT